MAITPWGVPRCFSLSEAAYLMAGVELWTVDADFVPPKEEQTAEECKIMLFEAARRGEVEPFFDEVPEEDWRLHSINEVQLTFERAEIYRWLRALGYADADINEQLRVPVKPQPLAEQVSQQHAVDAELRTLEAFGLLAELYASRHGPNYRHGSRPKVSRIVEDMLDAVPDDVTKMGERKLKEQVGAAIEAWEAKKSR